MTAIVSDTGDYPLHMNTGRRRTQSQHTTLEDTLRHYLSGPPDKIFSNGCPSARMPAWWAKENGTGGSTMGFSDLGYNIFGLGSNSKEKTLVLGLGTERHVDRDREGRISAPVREGAVKSPGDMVAFGDSFIGNGERLTDGARNFTRTTVKLDYYVAERTYARVLRRHDQGMNICFADGHVDMLGIKEVFQSDADESYSRWNRNNEPHRELLGQ